ncbi:NAD(P)H-dependent oxidoreductase [Streptomyces acidicola]|uniref:NAD(P)H-dependent oxidoreductase n=1 Tax=Streptomyces acidicola TaxID=2596892 RepID=UPI003788F645
MHRANGSTTIRGPEIGYTVHAVSRADGPIVGSPGYCGGISGPVRNALDLLPLVLW